MSPLDDRLKEIASAPVLLVATDYDGTMSPIVPDPARARPLPESIQALRRLARLPRTHVAIISGRALQELARMTGLGDEAQLVGSHGWELDSTFAGSLPPETAALRRRVLEQLAEIAGRDRGLLVEAKPASVALHYRNAPAPLAESAVQAALDGPGTLAGVLIRHGKKVIELSVVALSKGTALQEIRRRCGATATVFFGDDLTDEEAFGTMGEADLPVKVGPGPTLAPYRVESPEKVASALERLGDLRMKESD